ncbi:polymer-forming cytoskeletal protein [Thermodesulfobacteriota bacterium]
MTIFGKSDQSATNRANTTIIASGTKLSGEIQVGSKMQVDGEFSGTINAKSIIYVGKTGLIEGEIVSQKLVVTGCFLGTAHCEEIEILASGKVVGQITSKVLVIERGGFFEGESKPKESARESSGRPTEDILVVPMNRDSKVSDVG